ncbi:hypothetical protein N7541_009181 [Penicillium brevicompactum]|uniref:Uncharacterized protein n=1 Tax=Penicillium brevicompactum TaxID=5074 RepID=A0A9W9QW84_PENBR|nr:hypothetical protein N7541_009181 [Penicillium brevicompactum]
MTVTAYRACHALAVATVILLGTWILVKQFCDIPQSWRADRGTSVFRGNLPSAPQYDLPSTPSASHQPESTSTEPTT